MKKVEPALYDAYAGRYRGGEGPRSDFVFTIAKEGERLTAEFIGQKVELFPESESQLLHDIFTERWFSPEAWTGG